MNRCYFSWAMMVGLVLVGLPATAYFVVAEIQGDDAIGITSSAHAQDLGIAGNAPKTVELWVFLKSPWTPESASLFYMGDQSEGGGGGEFSLRTLASTNAFRVQLHHDDFDFRYPARERWVHLALVHTGSDTIVYADGEEIARREPAGPLDTGTSAPFAAGFRHPMDRGPLRGYIDDVRIWNVVRTQEEIRENRHHFLSGAEPGLVLYWPLNEGEGETTDDASGNGHTGHLNDATWAMIGKAPDLSGLTFDGARSMLEDMGYEVGVVTRTPGDGTIVGQEPRPGERAAFGQAFDVMLGVVPVNVPDLIGTGDEYTVDDAAERLSGAGLTVGKVGYVRSDAIPVGFVVEQFPKPGTEAFPGDSVDVGLSGGDVAEPKLVKNLYATIDWDRVNQYKANLHSHTIYSDGRAEPDELITIYAEAGYDILAITDHDNYHETHANGRETIPTHETTWPWTRWISEQPSVIWHRDGMESAVFYPGLGNRGMLAIRGNELSSDPHIVSLYNDCGYTDHYPSDPLRAFQTDHERMACVQAKGGLAFWAHPSDYTPTDGPQESILGNCWATTLDYFGTHIIKYDSTLGIELQLRSKRDKDLDLLDRLLDRYYRDHNLFIFGSDDNHGRSIEEHVSMTLVLAEELTEESVRHALKQGHTFIGNRSEVYPDFNGITVDEKAKAIILDIEHYDRVIWFRNGEKYQEGFVLDYSGLDDDILRFEVYSGDAVFYSQAFHVLFTI